MPTTTNFQIAYPASTDLVKDGASNMATIATGFDSLLGTIGVGGLRNAVINGDFSVNQRVFTSTTSNVYGFDRWALLKIGGTATYSSQAFTLGSPAAAGYEAANYARVVTSGQSAAGDLTILQQPIEDVRTFAGAQITVSFWARAGAGTPSVAVELSQFFGTGGSPSADVNNYIGKVQLTTGWVRYQVTATLPTLSGKTIGTSSNSSAVVLRLWTSAGTNFAARTGALGIQNATVEFWGVQVERGSRATPLERRPAGVELMLCERYYQKSYNALTAPGSVSQNGALTCFYNSGYGASQGFQFRTAMRTNPNLTLYAPTTGAGNRVDSIGSGVQTYTLGEIGESGIRFIIAAAGTNGVVFHYVAESEF